MGEPGNGRNRGGEGERTPALEWIAGGIGALLTLGMLGFLGWEAWQRPSGEPPAVAVSLRGIEPVAAGWVVEVTAANLSPSTAAAVEIEGVLSRDGQEAATSSTTLDYVPGHSERRGGLFFAEDPSGYELELRALGYAVP